MIQNQPGMFSLGADDLVAMKAAGVSDRVLSTMLLKNSGIAPVSAASSTSASADDPLAQHPLGFYMSTRSSDGAKHLVKLRTAMPKQVKSSGALLSGLTYGIKKAHVQAVISGTEAEIQTTNAFPSFYAYVPDEDGGFAGNVARVKDYSLVTFEIKGADRQINTATISPWGASMGVDVNSMRGFQVERMRPGVYKFTLIKPLPVGQYGFAQSTGAYFDFGITGQ